MSVIHKVKLNKRESNKFRKSNILNLKNIAGLNLNPDITHEFEYYDLNGGGHNIFI